jgi:hypothetical protein
MVKPFPRRGPPHSFGWLKHQQGLMTELWETPDGQMAWLAPGLWLEGDAFGCITPVDPSLDCKAYRPPTGKPPRAAA